MLGYGIGLSLKQQAEVEAIKAKPFPVKLEGTCAGCGRGIPHGYPAIVTQWQTIRWGTIPVHKPQTMYCRGCGTQVEGKPVFRRKRISVENDPLPKVELSPKEIAAKLLGVMSKTEYWGSKKIALLAELDWSENIVTILKKLREYDKVEFEEGRWRRL